MTANELMVGDWVLDGTQLAQVTSITCDGIVETTVNEYSNIEVIEPIPLTKEILDKNNLKYGDYNIFFDQYDETLVTQWGMRYKDDHFYIKNCFIEKIEFVHELQHFLKLLKVNKEIKL